MVHSELFTKADARAEELARMTEPDTRQLCKREGHTYLELNVGNG